MKIFHIITTICRGGAETQLLTLVKEQVAQKHEVSIFFLKGAPELQREFQSLGVTLRFDLHSKSFLEQVRLFRNATRRQNCLIHAHLPKSELIASLAKSNNKLLISRHNAEPFFPGAPTVVSNFLSLWVSFRSEGCICISHAVKSYLEKKHELLSSRKIWVVHYGYNSDFTLQDETATSEIKETHIIGTVSRLVPQKDLPTLFKAFKAVLERNPDLSLSIVGRGVEKENLHNLASKLQIMPKILWTEKTSNVYSDILNMQVFCLTSLYEGFGLVLLEAMQCGVPIVASRNSAIVEVLGDDYPYLFETSNSNDLAEKINFLLYSEHREIAIQYLVRRLILFSPDIMAKKVNGIYQEITSV